MPSPGLDLHALHSFVVAADSGTLGRAALRLSVSQPALTKRLQGLERVVGTPLLDRSPHGVTLTPAGRRLYEHAKPLLEAAEDLETIVVGLRDEGQPLRLAASHSSTEAFVAEALAGRHGEADVRVELLTANSQVVRNLVAERRVDLGVAASRPGATPNPAVREVALAEDEVVCAVPRSHPWAARERIALAELVRTPLVLRDRSSNARWTVDAALRKAGVELVPPLVEAPTPGIARREAMSRNAPLLLSRRVLSESFHTLAVDGVRFTRRYELILPAVGAPTAAVAELERRFRAALER